MISVSKNVIKTHKQIDKLFFTDRHICSVKFFYALPCFFLPPLFLPFLHPISLHYLFYFLHFSIFSSNFLNRSFPLVFLFPSRIKLNLVSRNVLFNHITQYFIFMIMIMEILLWPSVKRTNSRGSQVLGKFWKGDVFIIDCDINLS